MVRRVLIGIAVCTGILCLFASLTLDNNKGFKRARSQQQLILTSLMGNSNGQRFIAGIDRNPSTNGSDVMPEDLRHNGVNGSNDVARDDDTRVPADNQYDDVRSNRQLTDIDQSQPDIEALYRQLVVVTAFSQNHFKEAMGMIGTVQETMPQTRIVVYDIGIKDSFKPKVKALCNVEVRPFQFHRYPRFVSNLLTYSWKIIIIKETLNEFGAIFWADASVRFKQSLKVMLPFALEHHGYLSRIHSYKAHTKSPVIHNFYYTHELMYKAIGVDKVDFSKSTYAPHLTANRQLVINSSTVQQNYLRPLYACALDESCISPPGSKFGQHRYDASALMLVIYKYFPGEFSRENDHLKDWDQVMYMHRLNDDWETAKSC